MVRFVLAVALAGCASHAASGPAWPKPHATGEDGGESLAPHEAHGDAAAEVEHSDDDAKPSTAAPATPAAQTAEPAAAPAATPAQPSGDDTIIIDDIIINVDE
jgi:hypothetical protein